MRLDLSKEQIKCITDSLSFNIDTLETERDGLEGSVKDIVEEGLSVRKATYLYLKSIIL